MRTDKGWRRFYALGWLTSVVLGAAASHQWRMHVREVERRAEEAERTRDALARRRALEERLRIARELHDSLTHSISVIKVQAGVAVHLDQKNGRPPSDALLAIEEASGEAARELRATLDVLRRPEEGNGTGLDHLPALVERTRSSGLPTTFDVRGPARPLPPDVDRAAYRVVQEALTNVARHARDATATVRIEYGTDRLVVQVDDDGAAVRPPTVPGYGLVGMRERVSALGGTLRAEPRAERGFSVRAELPVAT